MFRSDLTRDEAGMYRWNALDGVEKSLYHRPGTLGVFGDIDHMVKERSQDGSERVVWDEMFWCSGLFI